MNTLPKELRAVFNKTLGSEEVDETELQGFLQNIIAAYTWTKDYYWVELGYAYLEPGNLSQVDSVINSVVPSAYFTDKLYALDKLITNQNKLDAIIDYAHGISRKPQVPLPTE